MLILNNKKNEEEQFPRRQVLKSGLIVATAAMLWWPNTSEAKSRALKDGREVRMKNMHTGEKFKGEYWYKGTYIPDAFQEIKSVMKDHRAGISFPIDPRLMDILFVLQQRLDNEKSFEVFSGYRSPQTNKKLRRMTFGVAKKSLHMTGQAIDLRLPGSRLRDVRKQAAALRAGGVGYYPKSNFLHIDTGRVRQW